MRKLRRMRSVLEEGSPMGNLRQRKGAGGLGGSWVSRR